MTRALECLNARVQMIEGIVAGFNAGRIAAMPVAGRPEGTADLDRGVWVRDDSGKLVWLRANT
jgi:hypothetical protein